MAGPPPDPRFFAALKSRRSGDTAGAKAQLLEILAADPDHPDALEVLGMILGEEGELDRAIEVTGKLAELQPDSIMAHANISRFYMLKGDKETAEEWQAKARVLGWKEEVGRKASAAGDASNPLDGGIDPAVVERQEAAVAERPDDPLARMTLARSYQKLGMPAKAVSHLRKALDLDATLSTVYLELGKCLESANMKQDAIAVYEQGVPLADKKGDLMPRNQMASRLAALKQESIA